MREVFDSNAFAISIKYTLLSVNREAKECANITLSFFGS